MLRHLRSLAFGTAALLATSQAVAANCAPRDTIIERLQGKYTETLAGRGLQEARSQTVVLEVWASNDTGTFTVLMTNAQGISCVMAAGTHWFEEPEATVAEIPKGTPS